MDKAKLGVIAAATGVLVMAMALTGGALYKKQQEDIAAQLRASQQQELALQEEQAKKEAEENSSRPQILPIEENPAVKRHLAEEKKAQQAAGKDAESKTPSSVPEVTVSKDNAGNQTITPEVAKPAPPEHGNIHDPNVKPDGTPADQPSDETPKTDKPTGGTQQPETEKPSTEKPSEGKPPSSSGGGSTPQPGDMNDKGEVYVPGFGWMKPTGGETIHYDVDLSGELVGY